VPKVLPKRRVILSLDRCGGSVLALFMDLKNRGEEIGGHRCQNKRFSTVSNTGCLASKPTLGEHRRWSQNGHKTGGHSAKLS